MNPSKADISLTVLEMLPPELKLKIQLSYNALTYELGKLIIEHGPMAILAISYLGDQIHDIDNIKPSDIKELPFEPLELL